jgi:hypothetical protein
MSATARSASAPSGAPRSAAWVDTGILVSLAAARIVLHLLTNGHSDLGFHRDELATIDDARHLAWGYVAYPPFTPFVGRMALILFGPSIAAIRFFPSLAQGIALVLTGWMARDFGGRRAAQIVAGLAVAIAPVSLASGALFQYVSFDFLWWVLLAWMTIRLLASNNPRWWLGIGAAIGLALMTKYTIVFSAAGIAAGLLVSRVWRLLRTPWLWAGALLAALIFLPNLVWQVQHGFISLEFLRFIHARDIRIGRTDAFLLHQLFIGANPFTLPLWVAGLYFFFVSPRGKPFRAIGWMFVVPMLLFVIAKGRDYYLAPAYPMLLAGGAILWEGWIDSMRTRPAGVARTATGVALLLGAIIAAACILPIGPVNSHWWYAVGVKNDDLREEIGWPELVAAVAGIRDALPADEKPRVGILAANYGEAGAIDLYGPAYGLPQAISGTNSYWLRGYPEPPPQTLIVVGLSRRSVDRLFESCELAGRNTNRFGVENEESKDHPDIFVCRRLRQPWPECWKQFQAFG